MSTRSCPLELLRASVRRLRAEAAMANGIESGPGQAAFWKGYEAGLRRAAAMLKEQLIRK